MPRSQRSGPVRPRGDDPAATRSAAGGRAPSHRHTGQAGARCRSRCANRRRPGQRGSLATVFTSSGGDGQVLHEICETLATAERQVSPTRFHNSVHNAPAGYWSIATQSREPSISLCAYDWSFAAGLLEAAAQIVSEQEAVLLVSFDLPYSEPMHSLRPIHGILGVALLLARDRSERACARLEIELADQTIPPTPCVDAELERLRAHNPTGRALPLLAALAGWYRRAGEPGIRRAAQLARARVAATAGYCVRRLPRLKRKRRATPGVFRDCGGAQRARDSPERTAPARSASMRSSSGRMRHEQPLASPSLPPRDAEGLRPCPAASRARGPASAAAARRSSSRARPAAHPRRRRGTRAGG